MHGTHENAANIPWYNANTNSGIFGPFAFPADASRTPFRATPSEFRLPQNLLFGAENAIA
jgi:hypothetical protein